MRHFLNLSFNIKFLIMNKKFSTLMAGLMLASAFSVASAQTAAGKYENGKYYLLGNADKGYLTVDSESGANYGALSVNKDANQNLRTIREALWQVTVTAGTAGDAPKYSFVNVATGMTLSVPTPTKDAPAINDVKISGTYMEWLNGLENSYEAAEFLMSYVNSTEVVYLKVGDNNSITVVRSAVSDVDQNVALTVMPFKAKTVELTADDLNKELITNNVVTSDSFFNLTFNKDVTEGAAKNLFAATPLHAIQLYKFVSKDDGAIKVTDNKKLNELDDYANYEMSEDYNYVRLYSKDNGYISVDTVLHTGSEAQTQLPKFTYVVNPDAVGDPIEGNNFSRLSESANFTFAYEPLNDRVLIKVEKCARKISQNGKPVKVIGVDGNDAYTYWPAGDYKIWDSENNEWVDPTTAVDKTVSDAYVRLVTLSSVRELTVASQETNDWSGADNLTKGMLTTVKIGKGMMSLVPTTVDASGLYLIQFVKNSANKDAAEGNYYVANLGGAFGYAEQAKNQDYQHIPAAQWYVEKQGTIDSAPIKIWNREFYDQDKDGAFGTAQYQLFAGPDGTYFFRSGDNSPFTNDTVKFIPVSAASKADAKLGYKYVDEQTSTVETYVFNYLHGLAASSEVGLNTPIAKDSLVRVDETGETIAFRLVPVVVDDSYGYQFDEKKQGIANLIRNAYYIKAYDEIKFAEDNRDRYLTYDTKSKKYVMSTTPTAYFLKENNCVGDVHYYALVEANLFKANSQKAVLDADDNVVIPKFGNPIDNKKFYPASLAGKKVGSDDVKAYETAYDDEEGVNVYFFDKNGKYIVKDASKNVPLYGYYPNNDEIIELQLVYVPKKDASSAKYYYMNAEDVGDSHYYYVATNGDTDNPSQDKYETIDYASARVSVDDNTLDLTKAALSDKWEKEIRVSAFAVVENDAPLYRRFNGAAPETFGDASNAPLNLKFYRYNNDQEYLFENYSSENSYRDGINDKSISFLGVNNAMQFEETATRSYTMFVDTAYVRNNTRMPQYLIAVKPEVVEGDTLLCDASTHQHKTPEEALACEHSIIRPSFVRAMYLFNAQDSIDAKNYDYQGKAAYGAKDYTRLAFKDAVHAMDTLYILNPGVTTEQLIESNFKNDDLFANKIALDNNKHKNVVFQFRLLDEKDNRFLIESEAEKNGAAVLNKDLDHVCVAPTAGGWVKVQNGVPVIARYQDFNEASAQADVFDVNDEIKYDATANDEIAVEGVSVVAGNGQVTIMGAAGKNVTITNILGKVIASQVIASDNATIAVPAGIVAVAVEGEAAVKAIVK